MKFYVCKRMRLLNYLMDKGFNFIKTQRDRRNPHYIVWIFKDSPELRECVEEYYNSNEFYNR